MALITRFVGGLTYLGASAFWGLLMLVASGLRCDDSCGSSQSTDWTDNPDAWQYGVIGWFGAAGFLLAVAAIVLSVARRELGLVAFAAHVAVFLANLVIVGAGRPPGGIDAVFVPALVAAAAGFAAVGGRAPARRDA